MDIFSYFDDETRDIEKRLDDVVTNYKNYSTELVFDKVKVICDSIMAHLKKQENLLLVNIDKNEKIESMLPDLQTDRARIEEEVGQLVMIHVNEPEYDTQLASVLKVIRRHIEFSRSFYACLKETVPHEQIEKVNDQLNQLVLHSVDYNSLQTGGSRGA
jgi:hypothetical protein